MTLELAGSPGLTDDCVRSMAQKSRDHLLIAGAPRLTSDALEATKGIFILRTLSLSHCPQLTADTTENTQKEMQKTGLLQD